MAHYRIYPIGRNGHFAGVEAASFDTEDEAMQHAAMQLGSFEEAEVWCGSRLVGRLAGATPLNSQSPTASAGEATSAVSVRARLLDELRHHLELNQYSIRLEWAAPIF